MWLGLDGHEAGWPKFVPKKKKKKKRIVGLLTFFMWYYYLFLSGIPLSIVQVSINSFFFLLLFDILQCFVFFRGQLQYYVLWVSRVSFSRPPKSLHKTKLNKWYLPRSLSKIASKTVNRPLKEATRPGSVRLKVVRCPLLWYLGGRQVPPNPPTGFY